mmetsp:Transcript_2067/g.6654  ORF Transcript_2067/g.6654 Transcript_2067/m.6654 type:complete len:298 (-) Transcript_2067:100-993(-)
MRSGPRAGHLCARPDVVVRARLLVEDLGGQEPIVHQRVAAGREARLRLVERRQRPDVVEEVVTKHAVAAPRRIRLCVWPLAREPLEEQVVGWAAPRVGLEVSPQGAQIRAPAHHHPVEPIRDAQREPVLVVGVRLVEQVLKREQRTRADQPVVLHQQHVIGGRHRKQRLEATHQVAGLTKDGLLRHVALDLRRRPAGPRRRRLLLHEHDTAAIQLLRAQEHRVRLWWSVVVDDDNLDRGPQRVRDTSRMRLQQRPQSVQQILCARGAADRHQSDAQPRARRRRRTADQAIRAILSPH